jgi:hypothetical protein
MRANHKKSALFAVEDSRQPKKAVCIRRHTHATKQPEAGSSLSVFPAY